MSLSEILVPNVYDLFANSITLVDPVINKTNFSAIATTDVVSPSYPYTVLFPTALIANPAFNVGTGVYTVPVAGNYHFDSGVSINIINGSTAAAICTVTLRLNISSGGTQTIFTSYNLATSATVSDIIPVSWFGPLAAGATVSIVVVTVAVSGGPITSSTIKGTGTWFYSN